MVCANAETSRYENEQMRGSYVEWASRTGLDLTKVNTSRTEGSIALKPVNNERRISSKDESNPPFKESSKPVWISESVVRNRKLDEIGVRPFEPPSGIDDLDEDRENVLQPREIFDCSEIGDLNGVCRILSSNKNAINIQCEEGMTALMCACQGSKLEIVLFLISHGADVSVRDNEGDVAVVYATKMLDVEIVDALISAGAADVNSRDSSGLTLLMISIMLRNYDMVTTLINHAADLELTSDVIANDKMAKYTNWTALMFAVYFEQIDIVKLLLANGAILSVRNGDNLTALDYVNSAISEVEILKYVKTVLYSTPLHEAIYHNDIETLKHLLVDEENNVDKMDASLWTPLFLACQLNRKEIVQLLIDLRADVYQPCGREEMTSLHVAASKGHTEIVIMLLNSVHMKLLYSSQNGDIRSMKAALIGHACTETVDNVYGMTPLLWASFLNRVDAVSLLLQHRASTKAKSFQGFTSLMFACLKGHYSIVLTLCTFSLYDSLVINETDRIYGFTALQWASLKGHKNIVKILLEHGADGASLFRLQRELDHTFEKVAWLRGDPVWTNPLLHAAVYANDMVKLKEILDRGNTSTNIIDVDEHDQLGWTCLHVAAYFNRLDMADLILRSGEVVNRKTSTFEGSAMYIAALRGNFEMVDLLCGHYFKQLAKTSKQRVNS